MAQAPAPAGRAGCRRPDRRAGTDRRQSSFPPPGGIPRPPPRTVWPAPHPASPQDRGEPGERYGQEHGQPDAFSPSLGPRPVEAVVPVPRSHQGQIMAPMGDGLVQRPHGVFVQGRSVPGRFRLKIALLLLLGQYRAGQPGDRHVQNAGIPGEIGIRRQHEGQPRQVVGAAGAHPPQPPPRQPMPPVEHVPLLKLDGRAPLELPGGQLRPQPQGGQGVLKLIPEPPRSAALVKPGAGEQGGRSQSAGAASGCTASPAPYRDSSAPARAGSWACWSPPAGAGASPPPDGRRSPAGR